MIGAALPQGVSGECPDDEPLPRLRSDLEIRPAGRDGSGAPVWTLHDSLQQRYFQIDAETRHALDLWPDALTLSGLASLLEDRLGAAPAAGKLRDLAGFLRNGHLTDEAQPDSWQQFAETARRPGRPLLERAAHNYLFFKVPLLRPSQMLQALVPRLLFLYARPLHIAFGLAGLLGLYLTSRQWPSFISTVEAAFSFEGAALLLAALVVLKICHELGHAVTAARHGCYVPTMGIAFMMMMPILYTDVSDSWRLPDRRQRLAISCAGIVVEIGIACLATLAWVFLPDGTARSIAFMFATTGWISSLAFNLNPCMKFDGYYILADLIGVDNLQSRSFAMGRWKLRQLLIAPSLNAPEAFSGRLRAGLVFYAWSTWLYRLILFTTIAILVYSFFFKALGIILFALEIWFLIVGPALRELREWPGAAAGEPTKTRMMLTAGAGAVFLLALIVPWSTHIEVPAVVKPDDLTQVYPPGPAMVASINVRRGDRVEKGTVLVELADPEVDHSIASTRIKIKRTASRLARIAGDAVDREETQVLAHELASLQTELEGLEKRRQDLLVRSPLAGHVVELDHSLHPGLWIGKTMRLALVSARERLSVTGYLPEAALERVDLSSTGTFVPDDLTSASFPVQLAQVGHSGVTSIDIAELASAHGGRVAVVADQQERLVPVTAQYLVELTPLGSISPASSIVRGVVALDGRAESLIVRAGRQIMQVLVRESGF